MSDPKTALVRDLLKHLAKYEETPPTLEDGEAHNLTLTQDAKLRTYDPDTHGDVKDIEDKLDHAEHGLAALRDLLVIVQEDLDDPDQYKADVSALALEATLTAIKGDGWTDETLVALKAWMDARAAERGTDNAALASVCTEARLAELGAANLPADIDAIKDDVAGLDGAAMRGTDGAALASVWTAAKAAYLDASISSRSSHSAADVRESVCLGTDPVDSIGRLLKDYLDAKVSEAGGATAAEVWAYATRRLTNLSDARAAYIDQLDFNLQEKLLEIDSEVEGLGGAAMRGTDNALLASSYVTERGTDNAALPGSTLTGLLRNFENYTPAFDTAVEDASNYVVVQSISGRGIWIGCWVAIYEAGGSCTLKYEIDGAGAVTVGTICQTVLGDSSIFIPVFAGFASSLEVSMKMNNNDARFGSVALVE